MITDELTFVAKYHYERGDSFPYRVILTEEMSKQFEELIGIGVANWPDYTLYRTPYGELELSNYPYKIGD